MSYTQWFDAHAAKHKKIVEKLLSDGLTKDEIIAYFDFENMVKKEPDFCPLYKELDDEGKVGKKCHDMKRLNCYLCACPNFRFKDEGFEKREDKTIYSHCDIESKDGRQGVYGEAIHQDCSNCTVPHDVRYVKKHYDADWKVIMKACKA